MDSPTWEHVAANLSVPAKPTGLWTLAVPYVPPKSLVKILAAGSWNYAGSQSCGPDGVHEPAGAVTQTSCICKDALVGSLVGKIGGGTPDTAGKTFGVGSYGVIRVGADEGGPLFLAINDAQGHFDDNGGAITVQIFIAAEVKSPAAT